MAVNLALLLKTTFLAKFIKRECRGALYTTKGFAACRLPGTFKRKSSCPLGALQSSDNSEKSMKTNYSWLSLCLKFRHDQFWIIFSSSEFLPNWRKKYLFIVTNAIQQWRTLSIINGLCTLGRSGRCKTKSKFLHRLDNVLIL